MIPKRSALTFSLLLLYLFAIPMSGLAQSGVDDSLPDEAYVCCVYGTPQYYPLSCESRAAVDWAAFFGVTISEYDFIHALPLSDNPEKGFVGSFNGIWGNIPPDPYGVHPPPVAETLRAFGVPAEAHSDLTWDDLRREIAEGRPAIVWVIAQMWPGQPIAYTAKDDETTIVSRFEHTMILTGYNKSSVEVVDPLTGETKYFYRITFLDSWSVLGNRAILAGKAQPTSTLTVTPIPTATPTPHPTPTPTPNPNLTSIYIIQQGDSVLSVARQHNLTWQALTGYNDLQYPYFIYPGDVLLIPLNTHHGQRID